MAGTSKEENWTPHDSACNSCRTRKIRCGREKPRCSCCCRDQVECIYSSPPKRVNHIKVLSQSFDDMQNRLIMMQGELSLLTETLKKSNISGQIELNLQKHPSAGASPPPHTHAFGATPITTGHVIREDGTQIVRYYGPWTLVALCRNFEADLASHIGSSNDDVVRRLVNKMLLGTTRTNDDSLDVGTRTAPLDSNITLPQKQLLSVMLERFLKQADYSTDIFCRQTIYEAVECVYRDPSSPTSEPWALCFNLIILLTLGTEHPVDSDDPFVRPILESAHATARKPDIFTSPRLVNIQGLALFSLLGQQHHTVNKTLSDSFFAQACTLARESGLHQAGSSLAQSSTLSAVEAEERQKVFRSLCIRDRFSATACGALTWLPSLGPRNLLPTPTSAVNAQGGTPTNQLEMQLTPHWELAEIQDTLHRLLSPSDVSETATSGWQTAFERLQQKLESWTRTHKVPSLSRPTTVDEVALHLAFLGTRIRMLGFENTMGDAAQISSQVLYDARLSCLLVATSCNNHPDQALVDRLDRLLHKTESTSSTSSSPTSATSPSSPTFYSATDAQQRMTSPLACHNLGQAPASASLPIHRLANVFPTAAGFVLARHILGIDTHQQSFQSATTSAQKDYQRQLQMNQDISLLETLLYCFRSAPPSATAAAAHRTAENDTHRFKFCRIIQHLVEIVRAIVGPTSPGAADDADDEDDNDEDDVYAPEPLLTSTSPLLLNNSSNAISMPYLNAYGGSSNSPSIFSMPPISSTSSSRSTWATPQDSLSSSATPLLPTGSSLYTPFTPATMPHSYFDIAQRSNQIDTSNTIIWDDGQGQGEVEMQQQQQGRCFPETGRKRSRKRPRTDMNKDQDELGSKGEYWLPPTTPFIM